MGLTNSVVGSYPTISGQGSTDSVIGAPGVTLLSLSTLFGAGDDGFAFDFTTADGLFQDSGATTPVTTSGDLIGYATDESGNGNDFTQGTASLKPEWIDGSGAQAIDGGDLLAGSVATVSDYTVIVRCVDSGLISASQNIWQSISNGNNEARILKNSSENLYHYNIQLGVAKNTTLKNPISDGSTNTLTVRYNNSTGALMAQFNDDTPTTNSRIPPEAYGGTQRILTSYDAPVARMIMIKRALSDDEVETAKGMVQNGWAA